MNEPTGVAADAATILFNLPGYHVISTTDTAVPVAGPVEVLWSKYRWYCKEPACDRLSFFESTPQVPCRARSTSRLRDHLVDAVIRSGCALAGRVRSPRYAHLQPILATEQDKAAGLRPPRDEPVEHGGYVRGAEYYAGGAK